MKTNLRIAYEKLELEQGSPEWKAKRLEHVTASQVAAIVGLCPYAKRGDLLTEKITGVEREPTEFQKIIFDRGHKAEEACREYAKSEFGIELEPAVLVSRKCPDLLASLDGFFPKGKVIFEAKYMGEKALEELAEGKVKPHHMIQVQAQLYVSGAKKCIYFAWCDTGAARSLDIYPDPFYALYIPMAVGSFMRDLKKAKAGEVHEKV